MLISFEKYTISQKLNIIISFTEHIDKLAYIKETYLKSMSYNFSLHLMFKIFIQVFMYGSNFL